MIDAIKSDSLDLIYVLDSY